MTKQTTQTKQANTNTNTNTNNTKPPSRAARIRALLAEGRKPAEIAATLGTTLQYVYCVRNYDKTKAAANKRISAKTGKPVRKYTRRNVAKPTPTTPAPKVVHQPIYVEVPVPQPFSHFTFWQRLRILFTGRTSV